MEVFCSFSNKLNKHGTNGQAVTFLTTVVCCFWCEHMKLMCSSSNQHRAINERTKFFYVHKWRRRDRVNVQIMTVKLIGFQLIIPSIMYVIGIYTVKKWLNIFFTKYNVGVRPVNGNYMYLFCTYNSTLWKNKPYIGCLFLLCNRTKYKIIVKINALFKEFHETRCSQ